MDVFEDRPVLGSGADGFSLARLEFTKDPRAASHAHGFIPQNMADLGLIGLLVSRGADRCLAVAAARTVGFPLRRQGRAGPDWTEERLLLIGLALVVVAYGFQSSIDWTWFIPGPTVAAIVAAGFVAGRGPLASVGEAEPAPPDRGQPAIRCG